ncbi:hypothetical protein WJX81_004984 [Elliptochloris bilobata]|uniref:Uncharacterized protein n=1 Tax=Elliptochloris bilobata TaxID=381761 RepID=A0AAW1RQS7_9CHLO
MSSQGSLKRCESEALDEALDEIRCILKGSAPLGPACFACSPPLRDFGCPLTHAAPFGRCTPKQKKGAGVSHATPRVGPHTSA